THIGNSFNTAETWDVTTGKVVATYRGPEATIVQLARSPDHRRLAALDRHGVLTVWDAPTGRVLRRLSGAPRDKFVQLQFSPGADRLACSYHDGVTAAVRLFDLDSGKELFALHLPQALSTACAFSPDGRWLTAAPYSDAEGKALSTGLWEVETG